MRMRCLELSITPSTIRCCTNGTSWQRSGVDVYYVKTISEKRTTIRNDPFVDLSEDSRRRQRFHDQQSCERDEFAWFLEATFGWQSPERMAVKCKAD